MSFRTFDFISHSVSQLIVSPTERALSSSSLSQIQLWPASHLPTTTLIIYSCLSPTVDPSFTTQSPSHHRSLSLNSLYRDSLSQFSLSRLFLAILSITTLSRDSLCQDFLSRFSLSGVSNSLTRFSLLDSDIGK